VVAHVACVACSCVACSCVVTRLATCCTARHAVLLLTAPAVAVASRRAAARKGTSLAHSTSNAVNAGVASCPGSQPKCSSNKKCAVPSGARYNRRRTRTSPMRVTSVRARQPSTAYPAGRCACSVASSATNACAAVARATWQATAKLSVSHSTPSAVRAVGMGGPAATSAAVSHSPIPGRNG
jgi:hypothetical protein